MGEQVAAGIKKESSTGVPQTGGTLRRMPQGCLATDIARQPATDIARQGNESESHHIPSVSCDTVVS